MTSLRIPISALLPPSTTSSGPTEPLPDPVAIAGELPATAPLHISLAYLSLADIPEFTHSPSHPQVVKRPRRVLIITGEKDGFHDAIRDEDEDWMRDHGGHYSVVHRLKRVDIRYCPTAQHLLLLLTLLSVDEDQDSKGGVGLKYKPDLVVLWNIAELLGEKKAPEMESEKEDLEFRAGQVDNSERPGRQEAEVLHAQYHHRRLPEHRFGSSLGRLADLVSVPKPPVQMVLLEPRLTATSSLPISSSSEPPSSITEKRIRIVDGWRRILGEPSTGTITKTLDEAKETPTHGLFLNLYPNERFGMSKRRCARNPDSSKAYEEALWLEHDVAEDVTKGGIRWDWVSR
ncbi:hypothetical protein P7C73_g2267, partial [Tremellales sp. Uapishka_1]